MQMTPLKGLWKRKKYFKTNKITKDVIKINLKHIYWAIFQGKNNNKRGLWRSALNKVTWYQMPNTVCFS